MNVAPSASSLAAARRDVFLDQWLNPAAGPLADVAALVAADVERTFKTRTRRDAVARRGAVVSNIVANLASLHFAPGSEALGGLAVSTDNQKPTRYDRHDLPHYLRGGVLHAMEEAGAIRIHPYAAKQRQTTVEASPQLIQTFAHAGVTPHHVERIEGGETVWLAARTGRTLGFGAGRHKQVMPYADTDESRRFRAEMESINAHLATAEIAFDGELQPHAHLRRRFMLRTIGDPVGFNLGGRLGGGFWMNLRSRDRHRITVRGEPLADLDFSTMFANLAYVRCGEPLPMADPYAIPGLEGHREGAKTGLISLLSRSSDMLALKPELKALLPEGWTARHFVAAASAYHPRIAHLFGTDVGLDLMFTESQILVKLLLMLQDADIPALPMHDGIMVPVSTVDRALQRMDDAAFMTIGTTLPVKRKAIWRPCFSITPCTTPLGSSPY